MSRTYLALPNAFTAAECERLVGLAKRMRAEPGPVWDKDAYRIDRSQRDVHTCPVDRSAETAWLFDRLDRLFAAASDAFSLPVGPVSEAAQILRYETGCHFRSWHSDAGLDAHERRRISTSIELSNLADYEGGELEIVPDRVGCRRILGRGGAQLFPSRAIHRVTPVTRGVRWALIAWAGAPGA